MTPRTQKVTFARAGLSVGRRGRLESGTCRSGLRAGGGRDSLTASIGRGSLGAVRCSAGDGNRVPDDDGVVDHQHFFDQQPDNPLALRNIQRVSRFAQAIEERRQRLSQAQICSARCDLIRDRLQFRAIRAFALA